MLGAVGYVAAMQNSWLPAVEQHRDSEKLVASVASFATKVNNISFESLIM